MIIGAWGEDKCCKTTFALSFPKPMVFMEFDIGGFDRAIYRYQKDFDEGRIIYEDYPMPMTFGKFDPTKLSITPSPIIIGMKELFYKWAGSYIKHLQDPKIASIVIDTATLLNSINADCYLQELQEKQMPLQPNGLGKDGKKLREQLIRIEYREPNNRFRGILYNAKSSRKHLILVHHAQDEYGMVSSKDGGIVNGPTGKRKRAGFTTLGDAADVIIHNYWDKTANKPMGTVELAEVKMMEGMTFEEPNYEQMVGFINFQKGLVTQQ